MGKSEGESSSSTISAGPQNGCSAADSFATGRDGDGTPDSALWKQRNGATPAEAGVSAAWQSGDKGLPDRIARRIKVSDGGCWIWTGAKAKNGYGAVRVNGSTRSTHRTVYEMLVGPVPPGLQIDHTCCVRACCNPAHLEPVTPAENSQRIDRRGRPRNTYVKPPFIGPRLQWEPIVPRTTPRGEP